jgi:phosphoribosylformylglycinamidine (FGAM) synthase PurS component
VDRAAAEKLVPEIAGKVLANPIIEKYTWSVIED